MNLLDVIKEGKKQGYDINEADINFCLLSLLISNNTEAYSITHKQLIKPKANITSVASNLYRTPKQIYLRETLQQYFNEKIKKQQSIANPEIMLTEVDTNKGVTASYLRDYLLKILENTKNSQEIFSVVKLLVDKFELDDNSEEKNKHIIILPAKSNAICPVCHTEV